MRDSTPEQLDEIGSEYDLSENRPNPYATRYAEGTNLVRLDADVATVFPDSDSVNRALRALINIIKDRSDAA